MPGFILKFQLIRLIAVSLLVTAAVVVAHLLPGLDSTEVEREIRNGLHLIGFALIAAIIFEALPMRTARTAGTTLLLVAVLGGLAELVQSLDGKGYDFGDLVRDIMGAAIYLCARGAWISANSKERSSAFRFSTRLVSIVLGVLLFAPLSYWLSINASIAAKFPTVLDFEGRWDHYIYQPVNAELSLVARQSSGSESRGSFMEILLLHRRWSGLTIKPVVSNWSSYQFISMRVAIVGGVESKISAEISDGEHPGYRAQHHVGEQNVGPEWTVIRFPLAEVGSISGRPGLDPSNVTAVNIIARTRYEGKDKSGNIQMYLDDIWLE